MGQSPVRVGRRRESILRVINKGRSGTSPIMENIESILDELNDYEQQKTAEIPKVLEEYITHLAKTGDTLFPWSKVRTVLRRKLEIVIAAFREVCPIENVPPCPNVEPFNYEMMKDKILEQFDSFTYAPFTIQRLCELLCAPRKHYKRTDKFMRGIEKNLLVVSTVDPEQRKRSRSTSMAQPMMNGIIEVHVGPNRASLMAFGKTNQLNSHASLDVASAYDADSGISDTEDEDKLSDNSKPLIETEAKEVRETSSEEPPLPVKDGNSEEETVQSAPETENIAVKSNNEEASSKSQDVDIEDVEDVAEGPVEQDNPSDRATEPSSEIATLESEVQEVKEVAVDKKRSLEEDEDDEVESNREAKQARFFSPSKVIRYIIYHY